MRRLVTIGSAVALCVASAVAAQAGGNSGAITDQRYHGGKYSGNLAVMNNCPREYREMYRGSLYCRKPEYQVIAPRSAHCPPGFYGMYRGNLYCTGRG